MVHAAGTLVGAACIDLGDVHHLCLVAVGHAEAGDVVLRIVLLVAHEAQQFRTGLRIPLRQPQIGGVEAADRHVGRDIGNPGGAVILGRDKRKAVTVRALEHQPLLAKPVRADQPVDLVLGQPGFPEGQGVLRHAEHGRADLAGAGTARAGVREGEIGHHRAGRADLVAVVQVIDVRGVEVHRLLDPSQAKNLGEEIVVLLRARGERGHVVQSVDLGQHGWVLLHGKDIAAAVQQGSPSVRARSVRKCTHEKEKGPDRAVGTLWFDRSGGVSAQTKNCAPFAEIVEPLMKPASSEARNTTQRAISSGSPRRPAGIWAMIDSRTFSGTAMTISVAM